MKQKCAVRSIKFRLEKLMAGFDCTNSIAKGKLDGKKKEQDEKKLARERGPELSCAVLSRVGPFTTNSPSHVKFHSVLKVLDYKKVSQAMSTAQNQVQMDRQGDNTNKHFSLRGSVYKVPSNCTQM